MTLTNILDEFDFELEQKDGKLYIYDKQDDYFEETANTVKEVIDMISGHIESELYGLLEDICTTNKPETGRWEWKDWANYLKQFDIHTKTFTFLLEICETLSDIDNIEI